MSKLFEKIIIGVLLFTIFLLLTLSSVSESRVYDEIVHVNSGYQFLVNQDFRYDPFNPPFARELIALPLLINKQFANDPLLFYPRLVVIIFSVLLAFLVYLFSKKLFGGLAGILALSIFIIEPNILAYGHYASTDVIFTFFYILSFYLYYIWQNNLTMKRIIIFGIVVGLMLSTKTSALPYFFLPFIFILILKIKGKKLFSLKKIKPYFFKTLIFVFFLLMSLWSTYFFTMEPMLGYRFDPNRQAIKLAKENAFIDFALHKPVVLGGYISSIKQQIVFNYSNLYRRDSMILGEVSHTGQSGIYFPLLILIKVPIEITLLFIISLIAFRKKLLKDNIILIPFFFILIFSLFVNAILFIRYIFPIIPLMIIYSSQIVNLRNKFKPVLISLVLILLAFENVSVFPHYISYVNLVLGGHQNGYRYVFDANYDWGQGLVSLRNYQVENNLQNLKLAYFGEIEPSLYGLEYEKIYDNFVYSSVEDLAEFKIKKNSTYAISTTCWYLCGYNKLKEFKSENIVDVVGSILIFKF